MSATTTNSKADLVIRNGRLLDPYNHLDMVADIAVKDGKISAIGIGLDEAAEVEFDAEGLLVSAGWVDLHAHVYQHATLLGVNPDETCLARGVTTVVDAGSSGCMTLAGLRHYIAEKSSTRVLCFVHAACHGLAGAACSGQGMSLDGPGGESDHINAIKINSCVKCVEENRDLVVGIKVRLDKNITDNGRTEHEVYLRALEISERANVPLMVHHTNSGIPLGSSGQGTVSCPGSLRKGDIYTHLYSGHGSSIVDRGKGGIHQAVLRAHADGVIMDVGHGQGSFDWEIAEIATSNGFWPDVISTDLHFGSVGKEGPAKDLPHVMSKFLRLGMPMEEIISCVTSSPSRAISCLDEFGSLSIGSCADITVFSVDKSRVEARDCEGQIRKLKKVFVPKAVFREGKEFKIVGETLKKGEE